MTWLHGNSASVSARHARVDNRSRLDVGAELAVVPIPGRIGTHTMELVRSTSPKAEMQAPATDSSGFPKEPAGASKLSTRVRAFICSSVSCETNVAMMLADLGDDESRL